MRAGLWWYVLIGAISVLLGVAITVMALPWTPAILMPLVNIIVGVFDESLEHNIAFQLVWMCILNVGGCFAILEGGRLLLKFWNKK